MYQNVIVPFDGTVSGRAALAPANDLAWRCGARVVLVVNSDASDAASRGLLKSRAMSKSGADMDFWVDTGSSLGKAALDAVAHRDDPVMCVSARAKAGILQRARGQLGSVVDEVLVGAPCPVLVVGPNTDLSRGLSLAEIIVVLDGSASGEKVLADAARWASEMRLRMILVGVVKKSSGGGGTEEKYLQSQVSAVRAVAPDVRYELLEASDPVSGVIEFARDRDEAVIAVASHGRKGSARTPLGPVASRLVAGSPRAVLVVRSGA